MEFVKERPNIGKKPATSRWIRSNGVRAFWAGSYTREELDLTASDWAELECTRGDDEFCLFDWVMSMLQLAGALLVSMCSYGIITYLIELLL